MWTIDGDGQHFDLLTPAAGEVVVLEDQGTAIFQSDGETENRKRAEKSEATAGEIIERIGKMIFLESPSRPSALLLSLANSSETSLAENCGSPDRSAIWVASVPL